MADGETLIPAGKALEMLAGAYGSAPIHYFNTKKWLLDRIYEREIGIYVSAIEVYCVKGGDDDSEYPVVYSDDDCWIALMPGSEGGHSMLKTINTSYYWSADDKSLAMMRMFERLDEPDRIYSAECRNVQFYNDEVRWWIGDLRGKRPKRQKAPLAPEEAAALKNRLETVLAAARRKLRELNGLNGQCQKVRHLARLLTDDDRKPIAEFGAHAVRKILAGTYNRMQELGIAGLELEPDPGMTLDLDNVIQRYPPLSMKAVIVQAVS